MAEEGEITLELVGNVADIGAADWNALANPVSPGPELPYNPFVSHAFFLALEKSGSASIETGWLPQHVVMHRSECDDILGIIPCYLKNHSQGEYVFDHGWADAFERAGGDYYPKLQCAVPFTPATGRRLLAGFGDDAGRTRQLLGGGLQQVCERLKVSSAHITFAEEHEAKTLGAMGYLVRNDQQFHWENDNYKGFPDFLSRLSSRKRKNIKKERQTALGDNGISIDWLTGSDLTEDVWDTFFRFYMDTGSRKWGQPYLTRDFYSMIGETMAQDIVLIMARRNGEYVAGAINFIGSHTLYGRHWGCVEHHPFLHFEVCYYQAIDYAIANGLQRVEAGAQGSHKLARGYLPHMTHSAHFITHPGFRQAVEDYLKHERRAVEREAAMIARHGPFRQTDKEESR